MAATIYVAEIFGPTIQGEGASIGQPTVFVRTGGCDYRCSWCDTLHAVDPEYSHHWKPMCVDDIMARIEALSGPVPLMVTVSGGNPAIQPLGGLIHAGHAKGYRFAMETQGSIAQDWFNDLDILTLSPKPPSSGESTDWEALDACCKAAGKTPEIVLKLVILDHGDYEYAREVAARYPALPLYLQPVNHTPNDEMIDMDGIMHRMRWLINNIKRDQWYSVTVLPQLHALIWGNKKGV